MELQEAIRQRRSIRKFTDQAVDPALLDAMLKKALWAPSGMNRQPWKFFVLRGKAFQQLLDLSAGMAESMEGPLVAQGFNEKMRKFVKGYFRNLGGAKVAVIALSKIAPGNYMEDYTNVVSVAAAFYNFLLLAHEAGLSTCWMTGYINVEADFLKMLGVEGYKLVGLTPVGYPDQVPPTPPRKHEDIVWKD